MSYEFHELDYLGGEIRVLTIISLENDGTIHCSLSHVQLAQSSYTCLSYRRGTGPAPCEIRIDGYSYLVRRNLYQCLRSVSQLGYREPLWIDAISIDPNNIAERSETVRRMGDIYARASSTIVWLDVPLSDLDVLYNLRSQLTFGLHRGNYPPPESVDDDNHRFRVDSRLWQSEILRMKQQLEELLPSRRRASIEHLMNDQEWLASCATFSQTYSGLMSRIRRLYEILTSIAISPYWSWASVAQEIILSKVGQILTTEGSLAIGDIAQVVPVLPLMDQFKMEIVMARLRPELAEFFSGSLSTRRYSDWHLKRIADLNDIRNNYQEHGMRLTLSDALWVTWRTSYADVLDRVYSTYGLLEPQLVPMIVDYECSSPEEVYFEVVSPCVGYYLYLDHLFNVYSHTTEGVEGSDPPARPARPAGEELYWTVLALADNLRIVPPDIRYMETQADVLSFFSQVDLGNGGRTIKWARPERADGDSDTEIQERDENGLVGLYTAIPIGVTCLVLEQLFEQGPIETRSEGFWRLNCVNYPRAWIVGYTGQCTFHRGEFHRYFWPNIADSRYEY